MVLKLVTNVNRCVCLFSKIDISSHSIKIHWHAVRTSKVNYILKRQYTRASQVFIRFEQTFVSKCRPFQGVFMVLINSQPAGPKWKADSQSVFALEWRVAPCSVDSVHLGRYWAPLNTFSQFHQINRKLNHLKCVLISSVFFFFSRSLDTV